MKVSPKVFNAAGPEAQNVPQGKDGKAAVGKGKVDPKQKEAQEIEASKKQVKQTAGQVAGGIQMAGNITGSILGACGLGAIGEGIKTGTSAIAGITQSAAAGATGDIGGAVGGVVSTGMSLYGGINSTMSSASKEAAAADAAKKAGEKASQSPAAQKTIQAQAKAP